MRPLIDKYNSNPILTAKQWPYPIHSVFNPAATRLENGDTLLLCRCEDFDGRSHLCTAISQDGYNHWKIDSRPTLIPEKEEEKNGIEDARISWIQEIKSYAIAYTSCGDYGPGVSVALTKDFKNYERLGQAFFPENKDALLFTERINGLWAMIHRPVMANGNASMWISYSSDFKAWQGHHYILGGRGGTYWDGWRVGGSTPPIKTRSGWLLIYHSNRGTPAGCLYRCGLLLLDLNDPAKIIRRSNNWLLGPEEPYERTGDVDNVVFPCGWVLDIDNDTLRIYYGAADACIAVAKTSISGLLQWLFINSV